MKAQVVIIGGGPAGLLLAEILSSHHISTVILEKQNRQHLISRVRAGVLKPDTNKLLNNYGLGNRIGSEGIKRNGFQIVFDKSKTIWIDIKGHANDSLIIYGQSKLQEDLLIAADKRDAILFTNVCNVRIKHIDSTHPVILFSHNDQEIVIECDFIAGCDGFHGISRQIIQQLKVAMLDYTYPISWLGVLAETSPLADLTYVNHRRGFTLASMRSEKISRFYLQIPAHTQPEAWSNDRFWLELRSRFPSPIYETIKPGFIIEKSIIPIRLSVLHTINTAV